VGGNDKMGGGNLMRSKILLLCIIFCVALSSCAISKSTYLPDGSQGYSISCDGAAVGINVCFEMAGELCGTKGYDLINREGQVVPFGYGSVADGQAFVTYGGFNTKSILVRCRNPN